MKTTENEFLTRPKRKKKMNKLLIKGFERCAAYLFAGAFVFLTILSTTAQSISIKNEIQIIEGAYGIEKKQIIEQIMNLSDKENSDFWSIYDDYETKRKKLSEERFFLIHDYVSAYTTLTDAKAAEIALRCFRNDEAIAQLHKQYFKKVKRKLSPLKAAQFAQLENHLQNIVRIQIQNQLPFIGELVMIETNVKIK